MLRPTRTELLLFFLLGVAFISIFQTVFSFQSSNCFPQEREASDNGPNLQSPSAQDKIGREENGHGQPFSCSIAGTPTAIRIFMNQNEGFLVGSFTFLLAFATIYLVRATNRLWIGAEATSQRQLRAYISVMTGEGYRQGATRGLRFEFRPRLINTGETPAYGVNIQSGIVFLSNIEGATYDFEANLPPITSIGVMTLGKNQDRFTQAILNRRLTKTELRQFLRGTSSLFIFGKVSYRDTFKRVRYTNYCYSVSMWNKRILLTWRTTFRHNESD